MVKNRKRLFSKIVFATAIASLVAMIPFAANSTINLPQKKSSNNSDNAVPNATIPETDATKVYAKMDYASSKYMLRAGDAPLTNGTLGETATD
jgi:hypothetical protein